MVADNKVDNKSKENLKRSDFLKHLPKKIAKKLFLKKFNKFLYTLKNIQCLDILGCHYQVKKILYECSIQYKKNNSSLKRKVL